MHKQQRKDLIGPARGPAVETTTAPDGPREAEALEAASSPQALLQAAVKAAQEQAGEKKVETGPEPAAKAIAAAPALRPSAVQMAGVAVVLGLGFVGGWATFATVANPAASPAHKAALAVDWKSVAAGLEQSQADALRLSGDVRALKGGLESLKEAVDRSKQDAAAKLAQLARPQGADPELAAKLAGLAERLERLQQGDQDLAARIAQAAERLEKAENSERETGARLAQIAERLERIERQGAAKPVAAPPAAAPAALAAAASDGPAQTGSLAEAKLQAKPPVVEGWVLRDVYNGLALIEGKNQRLLEIGPGDTLPGIGRVEAIERRGKSWVVLTSKGVISSQQW